MPNIVSYGQKIPEPALSKTGFTLDGWYTEAEFINGWNFTNDLVIGNTTLFAKWLPIYTIHFNADGGSPVPVSPIILIHGQKIPEPALSKTGFFLDGWYTDDAFTKRWNFVNDTVTANITLFAKYKQYASNAQ